MAVTTELLLARHGEAACNVAGIVGGDRGCTGLTPRGRRQVEQLAGRLVAEHADRPFDVVYATPRRRVHETAEITIPTSHTRPARNPGTHEGQRLLVVAHGETIEAAHTLLLDLAPATCRRARFVTDHACLTRWQRHVNRLDQVVWMLDAHNDTRHVTGDQT